MRTVRSLLLVSVLSASVAAYPNGAPRAACDSMHPVHGHKPRAGTGGYRVFAEPDFTGPQTKWKITLNGTSGFLGFLLEARSPGDGEKIVGRWSRLPPRTKALDCDGVHDNAVTHHNRDRKKMNDVSLTWTASSCKDAPVYFKATVVKHYKEIYEGVTSDVLNDVCLRPPKCKECSDFTRAGRRKLYRQERARCWDNMRSNRHAHQGNGRSCRQSWDGVACWPETPAGRVATVPCPSYRPGFTRNGFAVRRCSPSGRWSLHGRTKKRQGDYTQCTGPRDRNNV
ncbi:PREDICTED: putative defense protein 3 [Branchiostoma belcheri]|uniref:Defense protein 3 n=1 Tax=Branchiostoma belcheri TaxID=7741 RepID=A0A6P4Z9B6_BRABE|nr:PREDICTED: putative defense protein 3 [Branchiostoma belcheri]